MRVIDHACDDPATSISLIAADEFFWLHVAAASEQEISALATRFGWHPLAVEDLINFRQRPKLDRYGDYMLIVFYGAGRRPDGTSKLIEVHLMVSGSYIDHDPPGPSCSEPRPTCGAGLPPSPRRASSTIVYSVLDTLTDTFFPVPLRGGRRDRRNSSWRS